MVKIRARSYGDAEHDNCGRTAIAVLTAGCVTIPLCSECVEELTDFVKKFNETVFCHKCAHFEPSRWGWEYDGKCTRTGYGAEPLGTCEESELKGADNDAGKQGEELSP